MSVVESISVVIAACGVIIATFYYINNLMKAEKMRELTLRTQEISLETRQAQLFMDIYSTCREREFVKMINDLMYHYNWDSYEAWFEKYSPESRTEESHVYIAINSFFEGVGVLLEQDLIDIKLVYKLLHPTPKWIWEKIGPVIIERRRRRNTPQILQWFEFLVTECEKYEKDNDDLSD
jgi:hypothetical protein